MMKWTKAAKRWNTSLKNIKSLIEDCTCTAADFPKAHAKVSVTALLREKQQEVACDVTFIEGFPVLHVSDKCTTWSETAVMTRRSLAKQIAVFQVTQVFRHDPPSKIYADNEYNFPEFKRFCQSIEAASIPIPPSDHQANGCIEGANRILKSYFFRFVLKTKNHQWGHFW